MCDLDPKPDFNLSVNLSSKSISVTVEPGDKVYAKWCYQKSEVNCIGGAHSPQITVSIRGTFICICALLFVHTKESKHVCSFQIDPSQVRSALLNISYLLPCVCVQVLPATYIFCTHAKLLFCRMSLIPVHVLY